MIRSVYFFILIFTFLPSSLFSQKTDYTVSGEIKGLQDTVVYLANYYGSKLYYNDTARVDRNGRFSFPGKPFSEQGKYALVAPGPRYFDILIAGEDVEIKTDTLDLVGHLKVIKSVDNQVFFDYIKFINERRKARQPFDMLLQDSTLDEEHKEGARDEVIRMNDEVVAYQNKLIEDHKERLIGKYIKMAMDISIPQKWPEGEDEQVWKYNWYRAHYWDNVDLGDNRMVRDQAIHKVLEKYINKVIPQMPDSICAEADRLIGRVEGQEDLFKYFVHYITFNAQSSKIMCMDRVFVYMVDNYYKTGKATWMAADKLKEVIEASDKKKASLCGEIAPNIILPDVTDENWVSLHNIEATSMAIVIWESNCGHCKKEIPKLNELYERWNDRGFKIYAIGNDYEREPWKKFIVEKGIEHWINVSDDPKIGNENPDTVRYLLMNGVTTLESLNFRNTFDISSTPKIYLLDENKKIVAKQLNAEQMEVFLERMYSTDGDSDPFRIQENANFEDEE